MKILYVGTLDPFGTCYSRFRALRELEPDIHGFDTDQHLDWMSLGRIHRALETHILHGPRLSRANAALGTMAKAAECSLTEYKAQLKTTAMFYKPQAAVDYTASAEIQEKMNFVRKFCFDHGLLGEGVRSEDAVGISYPDGTVQGSAKNVKMHFDTSFMEMAAKGELGTN